MNSTHITSFKDNSNFPELNSLKGHIDALIFDLDGTILDSMTLWNQVDIEFLSSRGFEVTPDYTDFVKRVSIDKATEYTKERYNLKESPEEIKDTWNSMVFKAYSNSVMLFDGVYEYITSASDMGFRIAAATALTRVNAEAALNNNGILDLFDALITLENLGDGIDKSTPDVYLKTAKALDVIPERCLVFEDVEAAIKGAKLGNFKVTCCYDKIGAGSEESWMRMCSISDYSIISWI